MKKCRKCNTFLDAGETCDCHIKGNSSNTAIDKLKEKIADMMSAQTEGTMQIKAYEFICLYYKILTTEYQKALSRDNITIIEKRTKHLYILAQQLCNSYVAFPKVISIFEKTDSYKNFMLIYREYNLKRKSKNES